MADTRGPALWFNDRDRDRAQLKAVLRKNYLLNVRDKRETAREIIVPIVLLAVLSMLTRIGSTISQGNVVDYSTASINDLGQSAAGSILAIAPCNFTGQQTNESLWASDFASRLSTSEAVDVQCFACETPASCTVSSEGSVLQFFAEQGDNLFAAVIFDSAPWPPVSNGSFGVSAAGPVSYRIRMDTGARVPGVGGRSFSRVYQPDGTVAPPDYTPAAYGKAFLPLQSAVDRVIAGMLSGLPAGSGLNSSALGVGRGAGAGADPPQPGVATGTGTGTGAGVTANAPSWPWPWYSSLSLRSFPTLGFSINPTLTVLSAVVPIYMTLIFTLQVRVLLTRVIEEKERKIKVNMQQMGLSDKVHWAGWLITAVIKNTIVVTVVVALACASGIFRSSSWSLVWVLFFLFELTCIGFVFTLTAFFNTAGTGGVFGMLIYLAAATPSYALTGTFGVTAPAWAKLVLSLLAPCAFNLATSILVLAQSGPTQGLQWSDLTNANITPAGVSMASLMGMLALDAVLYMGLAVWANKVIQAEFGALPAHPLFCLGCRRDAHKEAAKNAALMAEARETMAKGKHGSAMLTDGQGQRLAGPALLRAIVARLCPRRGEAGAGARHGDSHPHALGYTSVGGGSSAAGHAASAAVARPSSRIQDAGTAVQDWSPTPGRTPTSTATGTAAAQAVRSLRPAKSSSNMPRGDMSVSVLDGPGHEPAAEPFLSPASSQGSQPPMPMPMPLVVAPAHAYGQRQGPRHATTSRSALDTAVMNLLHSSGGVAGTSNAAGSASAAGAGAGTTGLDVEPVSAEVASRPCLSIRGLTKVFPPSTKGSSGMGGRGSRSSWSQYGDSRDEGRHRGGHENGDHGGQGSDSSAAGVPRLALDDLTLDLYAGQVTCLLGHNGAGKTTAVSVLTGLYPPSAGDATFRGISLITQATQARALIGVCPQHDVLFPTLTCAEHLSLYAGIKGMSPGPDTDAACVKQLAALGLHDKADSKAGTLSGGQKRRLSVAIALIGDPPLLFLDEPTSGLDPAARRAVWSVVQQHKTRGAVIVLTTHHMEEADILGDRIALMAKGRLRVVGSPLHLKARFGLGYHLTVSIPQGVLSSGLLTDVARGHVHANLTAGTDGGTDMNQSADVRALTSLVRSHLPGAVLHSVGLGPLATAEGGDAASDRQYSAPEEQGHTATHTSSGQVEVEYILPRSATATFPGLFRTLDGLGSKARHSATSATSPGGSTNINSGAGCSYSVAVSTLEDVYLRLAQALEGEDGDDSDGGVDGHDGRRLDHEGGQGHDQGQQAGHHDEKAQGLGQGGIQDAVVVSPLRAMSPAVSGASAPHGAAVTTVTIKDSHHEHDPYWWLDVRRRVYGHSQDALKHGVATQPEPFIGPGEKRDSLHRLSRQVSAQLWRRATVLSRTPRAIWLQVVTPVMFVGISCVFGVLRAIASGGQARRRVISMTPQQFSGALAGIPGAPSAFALPSVVLPPTATGQPDPMLVDLLGNLTAAWPTGQVGLTMPGPFQPLTMPQPATDHQVNTRLFPLAANYSSGYSASAMLIRAATGGEAAASLAGTSASAAPAALGQASQAQPTIPPYALTLLYNNTLTNGPPIILNLIHNALLGLMLLQGNGSLNAAGVGSTSSMTSGSAGSLVSTTMDSSTTAGSPPWIRTSLDPFPPLSSLGGLAAGGTASGSGSGGSGSGGLAASVPLGDYLACTLSGLYTALGFITIPALQAAAVVGEKENRSKALQMLAGATPVGYWLATWLWDAALHLAPWSLGSLILVLAGPAPLREGTNGLAVAAILLAFGLASPGPTYVATFAFEKAAEAQMWVRLGFSGLLMLLFVTTFALGFPLLTATDPTGKLAAIGKGIRYAGLTFPPFALANGVASVGTATAAACPPAVQAAGLPCPSPNPWTWEAAGAPLAIMLLSIPIWAAAVLLLEIGQAPGGSSSWACVQPSVRLDPEATPVGFGGTGPEDTPLGAGRATSATAVTIATIANDRAGPSSTAAATATAEDPDVISERSRVITAARTILAAEAQVQSQAGGSGRHGQAAQFGHSSGVHSDDPATSLMSTAARHGYGLVGARLRKVYTRGTAKASGTVLRARQRLGVGATRQGHKVAVSDVSLSCGPGEVLGVLGPNGAGKTTAIGMMVGDTAPTAGYSWIHGLDITGRHRTLALDLLGYCPQADALFPMLTTSETASYFATLSGVPAPNVAELVRAALASMDLTQYAHTRVMHLSGGNRRRLSLILAYIGGAACTLLDEPSTGVDPLARRRMHRLVSNAAPRRCTLLTTHVMEEAEALCDRIGIMTAGRLACLGSSSRLRQVYGRGYTVEVRLADGQGQHQPQQHQAATGGHGLHHPALAEAVALSLQTTLDASCGPGTTRVSLQEANGGHLRFEVQIADGSGQDQQAVENHHGAEASGHIAASVAPAASPSQSQSRSAKGTATPSVLAPLFELLEAARQAGMQGGQGSDGLQSTNDAGASAGPAATGSGGLAMPPLLDYSVCAVSLESVFLSFARQQEARDAMAASTEQ